MDLLTFGSSLLGSAVVAAIITGLMNYITQIKALKESGLYAKRLKVLDQIVVRLEDIHSSISNIKPIFNFSPKNDDKNQDQFSDLIIKMNDFTNFIKYRKHYLSKKLSQNIDDLSSKHFEAFLDEHKKIKTSISTNEIDGENLKFINKLGQSKENVINEIRTIIGSN